MRRLVILLVAALLLVSLAGAYTWQDHFTAGTSADYGGDTGSYTWTPALTTGWLNASDPGGPSQISYKNEKLGSGSYTWWIYCPPDPGQNQYPSGHFGAPVVDSGHALFNGNKYAFRVITVDSGVDWLYLYKIVGGAPTQLGAVATSSITTFHNITTSWDPSSGDINLYDNDVLKRSVTDNTFSNPGYLGLGEYSTNKGNSWDLIQFSNGTAAAPPVAAFTCTPLITPRNGTVTCGDASTETPTAWDWYSAAMFTGGPTCFSGNKSNQNPVIFPMQWGYCGLCEIASNSAGSDTECKPNYIYVRHP